MWLSLAWKPEEEYHILREAYGLKLETDRKGVHAAFKAKLKQIHQLGKETF